MFNYFNKFITGLGLNRAVFENEAPKRAPEGAYPDVTKEMLEQSLKDYSEGKVIMAAGETTEEYMARMEKEKKDTERKLAELEEKNTRKANAKEVKPTEVQTPFGPISVYKEGYPKWKKGRDAVSPSVKSEEALKGEPEKPVEQQVDEVLAQAESERKAQEELASLGVGEKPKKPMTDEEFLASLEESEAARAARGELASLENKPEEMEFSQAEVALGEFQDMLGKPDFEVVRMSKVLAKVSNKVSASIAVTGQINESNVLAGLSKEDLPFAKLYLTFAQDVYANHTPWLQGADGNEVAQVIYVQYLKSPLEKSFKNMAYVKGILKADMPGLTV